MYVRQLSWLDAATHHSTHQQDKQLQHTCAVAELVAVVTANDILIHMLEH
jgi:hypothetical protein